jgi:hypothetical protein
MPPKLFGFIFIAMLILAPARIFAQDVDYSAFDNEEGTSMKPIFAEAAPIIEELENREMEIVRAEFDLVFDEAVSQRQMFKDWEYGVVAFGDYRVKDIDVYVYKDVDGEWVLVKKDDDASSRAVVIIDPSYDGLYLVKIKVHEFTAGYTAAHYGLLIFHE